MMRRLSLFTLIFIVLIGLYWFLEGPGNRNAVRETNFLFINFKPANVDLITITSATTDTIMLQQTDEKWQVAADKKTSHTADSAAVQKLLEALTTLKTGSMVSRKSGRHALYEVSPETGVQVEALGDGDTLANVLIGKSGPNIFSTYVRDANSDEVFLVDGILQNTASKTLNEWRDKAIFSFNPELVTTYTVTGDFSLSLKKTDGKWWLASNDALANTTAVEQTIQTMASLNAVDFAEGSLEEFKLISPARTVTAAFDNGKQATLLLGKGANAFQQHAKTADGETIYIIEKHILGMLSPAIEALNEPEEKVPAEPAEPQSVTNH